MVRETAEDGSTKVVFSGDPADILARFGTLAPDGVRLLMMGKVDHGGAG